MHNESTLDPLPWVPRTQHDHFLFEGMEYPASKEDLVDYATEAEMDTDTLNLILALPQHVYRNAGDVWRSIAEATRVMAGGEGSSRDDLGKENVIVRQVLMRHP